MPSQVQDEGDARLGGVAGRIGDSESIADLIAAHGSRVARLTVRLLGTQDANEVDDMVQDVFVAAIEGAAKFRGEATVETWLLSITIRKCRAKLRHWRTAARHARRLSKREQTSDAPDESMIASESAIKVRNAIASLPVKLREVVVLHYQEGMSIADASNVLRIKRATFDVRLHRAKQKIFDLLKYDFEDLHDE